MDQLGDAPASGRNTARNHRVLRYFERRMGNRVLAEDILQVVARRQQESRA